MYEIKFVRLNYQNWILAGGWEKRERIRQTNNKQSRDVASAKRRRRRRRWRRECVLYGFINHTHDAYQWSKTENAFTIIANDIKNICYIAKRAPHERQQTLTHIYSWNKNKKKSLEPPCQKWKVKMKEEKRKVDENLKMNIPFDYSSEIETIQMDWDIYR